mmetsp:Transcript_18327/g.51923  ORF Transcript_18327/g.51923 Transcript_18327/m.51923 type:complete len:303 (+) Transcript_18327:88-996(+)
MAAFARGTPWFLLLIVQSGSLAVHEYRQNATYLLEAQLGRGGALRSPSARGGAADNPLSPTELTQKIGDAIALEIGTYTEYPQWLIITNTFDNFDENGDEKISRAEMDALLSYLGLSWADAETNSRMALMDVLNDDQLLQRSEFDFWFTWATPTADNSLNILIEDFKEAEAAAGGRELHLSLIHKSPEKANATEQVEWMHLGKSLPTAAQILGTFGNVAMYSLMMKLQFYIKMFDFNWSYDLDRSEFAYMWNLVDSSATTAQVDAIFDQLDIQTANGVINYNEFPFFFSPSFLVQLKAMNIY